MKTKIFQYSLLTLLLVGLNTYIWAQKLTVMTYNIRYDNPEDSTNSWQNRRVFVGSQIKFYHPDIVGLQEVLNMQLSFLDSVNSGYGHVGVGRDDGLAMGEYNPILYDANKFIVNQSGTFWLSQTPDTVSVGWDAALPRICTYALLHHRSYDLDIWVFNTHFDHLGEEARIYSADLITQSIDSLNRNHNLPVILMGDFNTTDYNEGYTPFSNAQLNDTRLMSLQQPTFGPEGTFNNFEILKPATQRIDYIFVNQKINVIKYGVLSDSRAGKYPSDHFPVLVELELIEN
jgi:endonuclease/exonuclease/phosphatase family metal-dependent hydrolase